MEKMEFIVYTENEFVRKIKSFSFAEYEEYNRICNLKTGLYGYYHINFEGELVDSVGEEDWGGIVFWTDDDEKIDSYFNRSLPDEEEENFIRSEMYPDYIANIKNGKFW